MKNFMQITFASLPENEALARMTISAFILPLNPTLEELSDVKTAVSEAVTNSIIHGYPCTEGEVTMRATMGADGLLTVEIRDQGIGIGNIPRAMQPFFSSDPQSERCGMGFTVMQSFMDHVDVKSTPHVGTTVTMQRRIAVPQEQPARMA